MLPAVLMAKAIQLCAAAASHTPTPAVYVISVRTGATLVRQPRTEADAEATVRDLVALGADFEAGPLAINGRDFATYGVTTASVFDPCALADAYGRPVPASADTPATVSSVTALIRRAFGARITDTIRPMNAAYGAPYSWHKFGQAIDFVPAGGVNAITREQVRALMDASGVRLLELLGPGDRGHTNHWHVAFARPGQVVDRPRLAEGDEDWMVDVTAGDSSAGPHESGSAATLGSVAGTAEARPPEWDVFAAAAWRSAHRGGS